MTTEAKPVTVVASPVAQQVPSITVNVPPTQMVYLNTPHEEATVTAPPLGDVAKAHKVHKYAPQEK